MRELGGEAIRLTQKTWRLSLHVGADGIPGTLSFAADPRMAQLYEGVPEELRYGLRQTVAPWSPEVEIGLPRGRRVRAR
jgi:hypothetical protein